MQLDLPELDALAEPATLSAPKSYTGLQAFHKYWGKKPSEPLRFAIEQLTGRGDLVVDPFLGSGGVAVEALSLDRRTIGIDVNPIAVRIARMLADPPTASAVRKALESMRESVKVEISSTYLTEDGRQATHYLWDLSGIMEVWAQSASRRAREVIQPSLHDSELSSRYADYRARKFRSPRFFQNSRINARAEMALPDLFTGRALRNIELIYEAIEGLPPDQREPMLLSLTSSVGQMSRMVFTISRRGKKSGKVKARLEVGSWVIGYWRPQQHFEINVWNFFESRVRRLIKALEERGSNDSVRIHGDYGDVVDGNAHYALCRANCLEALQQVPDRCIDLILTDPPHGDRIPYLELSELWNVILQEEPAFEPEIVVSNAKMRGKSITAYNDDMASFMQLASQKLTEGGAMVLFFNARSAEHWRFAVPYLEAQVGSGIRFRGCFPLTYSAGSVVQDNRLGALKEDFGLVFSHTTKAVTRISAVEGWTECPPLALVASCL